MLLVLKIVENRQCILKQEKIPTLNTYELRRILQIFKTNTITEESEPMLKDVLNSLSQTNGLLTNIVDRLENHLNNVKVEKLRKFRTQTYRF